jgi:hypothetical protein
MSKNTQYSVIKQHKYRNNPIAKTILLTEKRHLQKHKR